MPKHTPINISRNCYAMQTKSNGEVEITMYGEIVSERPRNWWTDEPIEGDYIIQKEFLEDFESTLSSGAKKIKLRMNSLGGDAGVSILIHNRIREAVQNGVEVSCVVDGVAMSGGSLIMSGCNPVIVNPSSLIMIHKCWSFIFGGYNADELRNMAKTNDAWDKSQISIYSRKTGMSETVISHMMSETTYMTGEEAVKKGFADVLSEEKTVSIAASANGTCLFVNGRQVRLPYGIKAPADISVVTASENEDVIENTPETDTGSKKGGSLMANNLEELRKENPALAKQVESEVKAAVSADNTEAAKKAAENERKRISEIDEIAHLFDPELVREAKYGENPCTAQELAFKAAQKAAKAGLDFMTNLKADNLESKVNDVPAAANDASNAGADEDKDSPENVKTAAKAAVEAYKKTKGVK